MSDVKQKGKIKYEATLQRKEAVVYFSALVDGLSAGALHFKQGEEDLELNPAELLSVEVKASTKGARQKVSFEIEWRRPEPLPLNIAH